MVRCLWVVILALVILLVVSCEKDKTSSGREFLGVWVDSAHRSDTLEIFKSSEGVVLFDNSMAFRTHPRSAEIKEYYQYYIRLDGDSLRTRPFSSLTNDYFSYPFTWKEYGEKFETDPIAFRPFMSCVGCLLTYERVK